MRVAICCPYLMSLSSSLFCQFPLILATEYRFLFVPSIPKSLRGSAETIQVWVIYDISEASTRLQMARTAGSETKVDRELTGLGNTWQTWAVSGKKAQRLTFRPTAVSWKVCCVHATNTETRWWVSQIFQTRKRAILVALAAYSWSSKRDAKEQSNTVSTAVQPLCPQNNSCSRATSTSRGSKATT